MMQSTRGSIPERGFKRQSFKERAVHFAALAALGARARALGWSLAAVGDEGYGQRSCLPFGNPIAHVAGIGSGAHTA